MFRMFFPSAYMKNVYAIDFHSFRQKGYKAIIFDIDNTLVPHGAPATPEIIAFFKRLHEMGYETMVMSNNKEPRVKSFAEAVGDIGYVYKANKPAKASYMHCMQQMHSDASNTLFVGDQLFTDVWGAKRCGIYSILLQPIHPKEEIQIVLKRYLERIVLYFYKKECERRGGSD